MASSSQGDHAMPWHDEETVLGEKQSLTSEGFLLCRDVPLARIGVQHYRPHELFAADLPFPDDRLIAVERTDDEVFAPASIRSFEGKPLVDEHPADFIGPDEIAHHHIGTVFNVRRGDPPDDDLLLGDLMITSPRGIALVRNGKRAVSVGYSANYDQTGAARARQTKIRANHIALVDEGRCGDRCMIGDTAMRTRDQTYAPPQRTRESIRPAQEFMPSEIDTSWASIVRRDGPTPGARLVRLLPGDVSSYFIAFDAESGQAALYYADQPQIDPGQVGNSRGTMSRTMDRGSDYYLGLARQANTARELAGVQLRSINAANRKAWEGRRG
jgi:hypothetical protein